MNPEDEKITPGTEAPNTGPQAEKPTGSTGNDKTAAGTGAPENEAPADPLAAAELRIAELEAERDQLKDRYLREYAENENIRKRMEREKADTAKYAISGFARDVLSVSDNLSRAISAVAATGEEHAGALKALVEGVELTAQELEKALERHGVRPIPAEGQLFDPNVHQAVMEEEDKSVAAGTVLKVFQVGYQIESRVLRPAMVVVSRGGAKPVKPAEAAPPEAGETSAGAEAANDSTGDNGEASSGNAA